MFFILLNAMLCAVNAIAYAHSHHWYNGLCVGISFAATIYSIEKDFHRKN